jgi:tRNA A-37 threonylcarbamoyl transferase component Bud32
LLRFKQTMKSDTDDFRWEILETQAGFFHQHGLGRPEHLISESQEIKKGHNRTVYLHRDRAFYIKRMLPRKARKEWRNWRKLYEKNLDTVTPVAMGLSRDWGYLISLAHNDWSNLNEIFDRSSYRQRISLLHRLGEAIRAMHRAGFYHGDLHGGNFLGRIGAGPAGVKMVDFQRGRFCRLSRRQRLSNLADCAISRYFVTSLREHLAFLAGYEGSGPAARDFIRREGRELEALILKRSNRAANHKVHKFRKANKYFHRLVTLPPVFRGMLLRKNQAMLPDSFLYSPHEFLYREDVKVLKDSRSVRVIRWGDVCVKYYKRRTSKDVLKGWMGLSKGKKSFRWALALIHRQIATPEPICYLDGRNGDAFYLSSFLDSTQQLTVSLEQSSWKQKQACLGALVLFLRHMLYRGVYHLDLKGSNILVDSAGPRTNFHLIDTDEVAIQWNGSKRLLKKSLLRITRTLSHYFNRDELVSFAGRCLAGRPVPVGLAMSPQELADQAIEMESTRKQRSLGAGEHQH